MSTGDDSTPLADGNYPVIVVDVGTATANSAKVEIMITAGPDKGTMMTLNAGFEGSVDADWLAVNLLGLPGQLYVVDGRPRLMLDDV